VPLDQLIVWHDFTYRNPKFWRCTLDLAFPKTVPSKPRPAIVVIHGGGWYEGDKSCFVTPKNRMPGNIRDFAAMGFVAAAVNYRLSGDDEHPAALHDCRCAIRWLRAHAKEYHIDPHRIGVSMERAVTSRYFYRWIPIGTRRASRFHMNQARYKLWSATAGPLTSSHNIGTGGRGPRS
jgi:alpha/beta hydrolase fold